MPYERRTIPQASARVRLETRDDGTPKIAGHAAVYYDGTDGTQYRLWKGCFERIAPGAFDRAAREDDVRALFNHDPNNLLGRTKAGTLRLSADATGLRYECDPPESGAGPSTVESIKRGDIDGSSFGFQVVREEWSTEGEIEVRTIQEAKLYDVSPVTFPAYEGTSAEARGVEDAKEARSSHEQWKNSRDQVARGGESLDIDLRMKQLDAEQTA